MTKNGKGSDVMDEIRETLRMAALQTTENAKQIRQNSEQIEQNAKEIADHRREFRAELKATRAEHNREMKEIRGLFKKMIQRIGV
jgi:septal ring factor EnvC (AmiA/AmiB activator)